MKRPTCRFTLKNSSPWFLHVSKASYWMPNPDSIVVLLQKHRKMYRSDVVTVSHSGKYLFATSRSNSPSLTGYIAGFSLNEEGDIEKQLCLNPTPTSGGHSNAISPCDWSDEWLALTDDEKGWSESYQW